MKTFVHIHTVFALAILGLFGLNGISDAGKLENILLNSGANSIFSPLSISSTLVPLQIGSDGKTKRELTEFLRTEFYGFKNIENGGSGSSQLLQRQGPQVNSVTALFISVPVKPEFSKAIESPDSRTKVNLHQNFNFTQDFDKINSLVRSSTNGLIDNIIEPGSVDENTKLIVVNAVHFKARWRQPFEQITALQPFYTTEKESVNIPMMTQRSTNRYAEVTELASAVVEIPYENGEYVMRVILPNDVNGLPKVLESLKVYDLKKLPLKLSEVDITLPVFRISNDLDLGRILKHNGLSTLFTPAANLSKLAVSEDGNNLFVDKLITKTVLDVSLVGTEGGSATAAFIVPLSGLQSFDQFIADHPFAFQIFASKDNTILFSGTFVKPKSGPGAVEDKITASDSKPNDIIRPEDLKLPSDLDIRVGSPDKQNSKNDNDNNYSLTQELTFYQLNNKAPPTPASNETEETSPWWIHKGKPEYLLPQTTPTPYNIKSPSLAKTPGPPSASHPRFQQPEPKHPTAIRFPYPLTDPTTLLVLETHLRNASQTRNTI